MGESVLARSRPLLAAALLLVLALASGCTSAEESPIVISIALQDDAAPADLKALEQLVEDDPRVERSEFVSIHEAGMAGDVLESDYPGDRPLEQLRFDMHLVDGSSQSDIQSLVGVVETLPAFERTVLPELEGHRWWWTW